MKKLIATLLITISIVANAENRSFGISESRDVEPQAERDRKQQEFMERERAVIAEQERADEQQRVDLKAGNTIAMTMHDLRLLYTYADGHRIAQSPLLKADKGLYGINGRIEREMGGFIICETLGGYGDYGIRRRGDYFAIAVDNKTKGPAGFRSEMRIKGAIGVYGRYRNNLEYSTIGGEIKVMPVFQAMHIVFD